MATLPLLLLCAGTLLFSTEAQEASGPLDEGYSKGVELVLEKLHSHHGIQHHFRFLKSVGMSEIESGFLVKYIFHNLLLKPTTCARGSPGEDPERCPFRNDRPLMDCVVCYKMFASQIEADPKPYVHCIQKPKLTKEMQATRLEKCKKMSYSSGAPSLLAVVTGQ